jgi:4-amino-4-deoxy-L-arabinose transferase-like glycosyltransferase
MALTETGLLALRRVRELPALPRIAPAQARRIAIAAFLAFATVAIRLPNFGDPTYHIDEAFYLYAGQRIQEGWFPYTEVWDRKPAGLFVLYATIAQLGSVQAYQLAAGLFAFGTALALARIVLHFAGAFAACAAGVFYLALLGMLAGGGGQSPVFYNLFIAVAAMLTLDEAVGASRRPKQWRGPVAMLLAGLALTIKPTALPEAMFLGLALLATRRRRGAPWIEVGSYSAGLVAAGVAPTLLIFGFFASRGLLEPYWFATVVSLFFTEPPSHAASMTRLGYLAFLLWLPLLLAAIGAAMLLERARRDGAHARPIAMFAAGWLAAAFLGFAMVPNAFDHYALPLAAPLAVAAAPVFDRRPAGVLVAGLATAHILLLSGFPLGQAQRNADARAGFAAASALIARHAGDGCLFVYDATPALYRAAKSCRPNRFAFPEHLSNQREAGALGAHPGAALVQVLQQEPAVVALPRAPSISTPNLATREALRQFLAERYVRVGEARLIDVVGKQQVEVWARQDSPTVANARSASRGAPGA